MQGKLAKVNGDLEVAKFKCDELENLARAYRNYQKISTVRLKVLVVFSPFGRDSLVLLGDFEKSIFWTKISLQKPQN